MSTRRPKKEDTYIIGTDEVGYGAWAGPLLVCAVAVPSSWKPPKGLTDSKALSPKARLALYKELQQVPFALMSAGSAEIDRVGVATALVQAHTAAIQSMLTRYPDAEVIVDGALSLPELPQAQIVPKADSLVPAVSAASVIAKVNRDFIMKQYHQHFPNYGFDRNVGYGTKAHEAGLARYGVCPLHRHSYRPIQKYAQEQQVKETRSRRRAGISP